MTLTIHIEDYKNTVPKEQRYLASMAYESVPFVVVGSSVEECLQELAISMKVSEHFNKKQDEDSTHK